MVSTHHWGEEVKDEMVVERGIMVEEATKVLMASQIDVVRAKLRAIPMNCISYSEFVHIYRDATGYE